jgi:hypothetical protein
VHHLKAKAAAALAIGIDPIVGREAFRHRGGNTDTRAGGPEG